jgi:hypothetical protein
VTEINSPTRIQDAITGNGNGKPANFGGIFSTFTFVKNVVGVFTTLSVDYQGSLDGTNWYALASTDTGLTPGVTFVVDKPSIWVRAVVSNFAGGTSVTVDVAPN